MTAEVHPVQKHIRRRQISADQTFSDTELHPLLARVYRGRGIESCADLDLALEHLQSPALLPIAARSATLLADALARDYRLLVSGSFCA